ncbi:hypothetical protein SAMN05421823_104341 [Catalinimonas alkaloidigena]|uniref:Uncharacterized protein n=1 Tax=Catalinimonas alkaloidigena TaxID=1075417 RepID=A0A1G9H749_9BACT|nr:hypothetical protein [Catalinimonas alkaloidigena]SDL08781.1 hypothetical protein SAMN05421823_104341 [Catalinimonas alkaloidigena]
MKNFLTLEWRILAFLWGIALLTYTAALVLQYQLYLSDYLGLLGLIIVTLTAFLNPPKLLIALLLLLLPGLFNLVSFAYFINVVFQFGISGLVAPGIQVLSLGLLILLVSKRRHKMLRLYQSSLGRTPHEATQQKQYQTQVFKARFEHLSDQEIERRLATDLVPEARAALLALQQERQIAKRV